MGRALVLAGGGIVGIAWESGVLAGLSAGGIDAQEWDLVVGTSAGAFVAARVLGDGSAGPLFALQTSGNDAAEEEALRTLFGPAFLRVIGLSRRRSFRWIGLVWLVNLIVTSLMRYAIWNGMQSTVNLVRSVRRGRQQADPELVAAQIGAVANTKRKGSRRLRQYWARDLGPEPEWPSTRLVITAVDTADGARALFDASSGVALLDAVSASTCLPGFLPPVELLGRRYMDGGMASQANADVAAGHEQVWIVSPFGGASIDRQVAEVQSSGSKVRVIRPGTAAEQALGPGVAVMDPVRRAAAARAGFADGRAAAEAYSSPVGGVR